MGINGTEGNLELGLDSKNKLADSLMEFKRQIPESPLTKPAVDLYTEVSNNTLYSNPEQAMKMLTVANGLLIAGLMLNGGASDEMVQTMMKMLGGDQENG